MICAYCGKEGKGTKEHIISNSVLRLFPECYLTMDEERKIIYKNDPMVKDVCAECNNYKISYIDTYASNFIKKYFVQDYEKDDVLKIEYDHTLIQKMCLKYAFNDLRSRKKDIAFFDEEIKEYLMDENNSKSLKNVTILAGLAVNVSHISNYIFGNCKLIWGDSPLFLENSVIMYIDVETGKIIFSKHPQQLQLKDCALTYVFRFNSLQLLMICWNKNISNNDLESQKQLLEIQYPYVILNDSGVSNLSRCTSDITYRVTKLIDVTWGQGIIDGIIESSGILSSELQKVIKELDEQLKTENENYIKIHKQNK